MRVWGLIALVGVLAGLLGLLLPLSEPRYEVAAPISFLVVTLGYVLVNSWGAHVRVGKHAYTLEMDAAPLVLSFLLLEPLAFIAARVAAIVAVFAVQRTAVEKVLYNAVAVAVEVTIASWIWALVLGNQAISSPRGWLAVLAALGTLEVTSALLIALVLGVVERQRVLPELTASLPWGLFSVFANASLVVVAILVLDQSFWAVWALVGVAVATLASGRAYSNLRRRQETLQGVAAFAQEVGSELSTPRAADAAIVTIRRLLQAERVELVLHRRHDEVLRVRSEGNDLRRLGPDEPLLTDRLVPPDWDGQPLLLARGERDPDGRRRLADAAVKDAIVVQLQGEGTALGQVAVADRIGDVTTFDEDDRAFLVALANQAGVALENASLADELRRSVEESEYQASHDALTGLLNRAAFSDRLARLLPETSTAVVMLADLDRFKDLNDTLGHPVGDELLVQVAERIRREIPAGALLARFGGDEFAICLPGATESDARELVERLRHLLLVPITVQDLTVEADMSVGATLAPEDGTDATTLLQRADVAMYHAKREHRSFQRYVAEYDQYTPRRLSLINELRRAVESGDLLTLFQPKVALGSGRVVGVEALVRWSHPRYGLVSPGEFVPIAEQSGLIRPLTIAVLRAALRQCAAWRTQGLDLSVAVNLSPRTLLDPALPDEIAALVEQYHVPAQALTLEVTEDTIMTDLRGATTVLRELSGVGVQLSVDDFGTGYSTLSYLKHLPVDEIKIDRSFVSSVVVDVDDAAIVDTVVTLSHRLGKRVVAEGVEDEQAYDHLVDLGCDHAQGFWMSRPIEGALIGEWVTQWQARPGVLRAPRSVPR